MPCSAWTWTCWITSLLTAWFFGSSIGCLASKVNSDRCSRPPTLMIPSPSKNGLNCFTALRRHVFSGRVSDVFARWSCSSSSLNESFCACFTQKFSASLISSGLSSLSAGAVVFSRLIFSRRMLMNRCTHAVTLNSLVQLEKFAGFSRQLGTAGALTANTFFCWSFFSSDWSYSSVANSFCGHLLLFPSRNYGPSHQSWFSSRSFKLNPLVGASAGLSAHGTCCHCSGVVSSRISDTLWATNGWKRRTSFRIQHSTSIESDQKMHVFDFSSSGPCTQSSPVSIPVARPSAPVLGLSESSLAARPVRVPARAVTTIPRHFLIRHRWRRHMPARTRRRRRESPVGRLLGRDGYSAALRGCWAASDLQTTRTTSAADRPTVDHPSPLRWSMSAETASSLE